VLSHDFGAVDKTSSSFSAHGKIGNFIIIIIRPTIFIDQLRDFVHSSIDQTPFRTFRSVPENIPTRPMLITGYTLAKMGIPHSIVHKFLTKLLILAGIVSTFLIVL